MTSIPKEDIVKPCFYLPHHAVAKRGEETHKIRVVFNASFRTSIGFSRNDAMYAGTKLHEDLWLVISRWRLFKFVFSADIIQMFRQIQVHKEDQDYQRIVWRPPNSKDIKDFRLTTVTYGTAPAPYLANRTIKQLAQDGRELYPQGAEVLERHIYVDDILTGSDTLERAQHIRQVIALLETGGFHLDKWAANAKELCPEVTQDRLFQDKQTVNTLGIVWSASTDTFTIRAVPYYSHTQYTKRLILSYVSQFFDPLGWIAPVLIFGKIFLQKLWRAGIGWDEPLPVSLRDVWLSLISYLHGIHTICIPRFMGPQSSEDQIEIHGFSDTSECAYSAVIYLRTVSPSGITTNLVVSKTRVASLSILSIPRLELNRCVLLAKLIQATIHGLNLQPSKVLAWTDAKVVLHLIKSHPSKWKPYVAHRVSAIREILSSDHWGFVSSEENPADLGT